MSYFWQECIFFHSPASAIISVVFLKETVRASDIFGKHSCDWRCRCANFLAAAAARGLFNRCYFMVLLWRLWWWFARADTKWQTRTIISVMQPPYGALLVTASGMFAQLRYCLPPCVGHLKLHLCISTGSISETHLPPSAKADAACSRWKPIIYLPLTERAELWNCNAISSSSRWTSVPETGKACEKIKLFSAASLNSLHRRHTGDYGHVSTGDLCPPQLRAHHSSSGPVLHVMLAVLALPRKFGSGNPPLWCCPAAPLDLSPSPKDRSQQLIILSRFILNPQAMMSLTFEGKDDGYDPFVMFRSVSLF